MSSVSQTPRRGALGFGPYFAIVMVVVALIVVFSVGPAGAYIVRAAGRAGCMRRT